MNSDGRADQGQGWDSCRPSAFRSLHTPRQAAGFIGKPHEPERAREERMLTQFQAVNATLRSIAQHKAVVCLNFFFRPRDCAEHVLVAEGRKPAFGMTSNAASV